MDQSQLGRSPTLGAGLANDARNPIGCDSTLANRNLEKHADKLFSVTENVLEAWHLQHGRDGRQTSHGPIEKCFDKQVIESGPELDDWLLVQQGHQKNRSRSVYVIRQGNSWAPLSISLELFQRLIGLHRISLPFLDIVHQFGSRVRSHDDTGNHYTRIETVDRLETMYVRRFFERNNREKGDPWSVRQMGAYEQIDLRTHHSTWVLLQPSIYIGERFEACLKAFSATDEPSHSALTHVVLLFASLAVCKEYIESLTSSLEKYEEPTYFSKADCIDKADQFVSFADSQRLQLLRRKFMKASAVLRSTAATVNELQEWTKQSQ